MNVLSLFSGIGGLDLGLEWAGMTTVGQVEIDEFCRRVLAKHWPEVPRHDDVRTAVEWWGSEPRPPVHVVAGGFPCTDIAAPGKRAGVVAGKESGLWSPMCDIIRALRPRFAIVENSPRVLVRARDGFVPAEVIAADLAEIGYDLEWDCIPAASVGAHHRRDRWFGIAHSDGGELRIEPVSQRQRPGPPIAGTDGTEESLANTDGHERRRGPDEAREVPPTAAGRHPRFYVAEPADSGWWSSEPDVGRVVDGLPFRLDRPRKRALGNAVVPQVAAHIGRLVMAVAA